MLDKRSQDVVHCGHPGEVVKQTAALCGIYANILSMQNRPVEVETRRHPSHQLLQVADCMPFAGGPDQSSPSTAPAPTLFRCRVARPR